MISNEGGQLLLDIARQTVEAALLGKPVPEFKVESPELQVHQGAFVTLTKKGELRGCLGQFTAQEPLYKVVSRMAAASALEDPRFAGMRLKPADLDEIDIEISVLSRMQRTLDPLNDIKLGVHGIYLKRGVNSGTFLPQVATDHNMTLEEFLSLCATHKAGLEPDAWKDPETEIYIYSAQVINEKPD